MLMTCLECHKPISADQYKTAQDRLGIALCDRHVKLLEKLIQNRDTPQEAIQLYYALKAAGATPMLEWWDGKKSVDIAISRVKLNIEIDTEYQRITHEQAINNLERTMHSVKNGFMTIHIPHDLVRYHLEDTVTNIMGIISGLKTNIKTL